MIWIDLDGGHHLKLWVTGKRGANALAGKLGAAGFDLDAHHPDLVVIWGGDGSILKTARRYPDTPLLGLRVESIGHLAETNGSRWKHALAKLRDGAYTIEEAPNVELQAEDCHVIGVNEVYFFREYEHATRMNVSMGGRDLYGGALFGDGCLAATPRGSRAYSWTAGRKIVLSPQEPAFVFTPLSSGYMNQLTTVHGARVARIAEQLRVADHKEVIVEITRGGRNKVVSDGLDNLKTFVTLCKGDRIIFKKAKTTTKFVRFTSRDH